MIIRTRRSNISASVLIIVLWVAFGLVSVALYFANSMSLEMRAADNRVAGLEAEQTIDGAARYALYLLSNSETPGQLPDPLTYEREEVPIGEGRFWFLGRTDQSQTMADPYFGLMDETGKLNLNTSPKEILERLPRMTSDLAAAIVDWRDSDSEVSAGGAEDETYQRMRPAYKCKNASFESVEELRLVAGMDLDILYGEDVNQNGILDPNENDGDASWPPDNRDGRIDPGLVEYVTVFSSQSSGNSQLINLSTPQGRLQLATLLQEKFGASRASQILGALGPAPVQSLLEFIIRSGMTESEFTQISSQVTVANPQTGGSLVNVNTASATVLACLPGLDHDKAETLVSYRLSNPDKLTSVAWVAEALDRQVALQAGPFLTGQTSIFMADICATGRHGRGYRRVRFIFDLSSQTPKIIYRRDLTDFGWALGKKVLQQKLLAQNTR